VRTSDVNGLRVRVPRSFEGILPVSPSVEPFAYEVETFRGMRRALRPGMVCFDIGCSFGVTTVLMALVMRKRCRIHAFDGHPDVFPRARELAQVNRVRVARWNNYLVGESTGSVPFFAIPGFHSVASTRTPEILKSHPEAVLHDAPMVSLDDYCEQTRCLPDCIKIDVEGSECAVLRGGARLLGGRRPTLIIETLGLEVAAVKGSVAELIGILEGADYCLYDLGKERDTDASAYVSDHSSVRGHLLAYPATRTCR